jgi:hypothetical protein
VGLAPFNAFPPLWDEEFLYANGALVGQGNWLAGDLGGTSPNVLSHTAVNAAATDGEAKQNAALAAWDPNAPFTLQVWASFHVSGTAVTTFTINLGDVAGTDFYFEVDVTVTTGNFAVTAFEPGGTSGAGMGGPLAADVIHVFEIDFDGTTALYKIDGFTFASLTATPPFVGLPLSFEFLPGVSSSNSVWTVTRIFLGQ